MRRGFRGRYLPDRRRISLSLDQSSLSKTTRPSRTVWLFGRVSRFRSPEPIKRRTTTSEPHSRFTSRDARHFRPYRVLTLPHAVTGTYTLLLSARQNANGRDPGHFLFPCPTPRSTYVDLVSGPAGFGLRTSHCGLGLNTLATAMPIRVEALRRASAPCQGAASHRELQVARRRRTSRWDCQSQCVTAFD
jgi:hypothetical protein